MPTDENGVKEPLIASKTPTRVLANLKWAEIALEAAGASINGCSGPAEMSAE